MNVQPYCSWYALQYQEEDRGKEEGRGREEQGEVVGIIRITTNNCTCFGCQ